MKKIAVPFLKAALSFLLLMMTTNVVIAQTKSPMLTGKWRVEKFEYMDSGAYHDPQLEKAAQQTVMTIHKDGTYETHRKDKDSLVLVDSGELNLSDDNEYIYQDGVTGKVITLNDSIFVFKIKKEIIIHLKKIDVQVEKNLNYTGTVVQMDSKKVIPFATVRLIRQNISTTTDGKGRFTLTSATSNYDSLEISSIGFNTLTTATYNFPATTQFLLTKKEQQLENVIVKNDAEKLSTTLNEFSDCGDHYYGAAQPVYQLAQHFRAPVEQTILTSLTVCKTHEKAIFRIRIYDVDPTHGSPGKDLADTVIEVKSGKSQVRVNLRPYNILVPSTDFFVAIEWSDSSYNRKEVKSKNSKDGTHIHYSPSISGTANTIQPVVPGIPETWFKNSNRSWQPMGKVDRFLIAVNLEF